MKTTIIYTLICLGLFFSLKLIFSITDTESVRFILTPISSIIENVTNSPSFWKENGYYFPGLKIVIDKSCSGTNFLLISFLMLSYIFMPTKKRSIIYIVPFSMFLSYIITMIANTSRIMINIILLQNNIYTLIDSENKWLHLSTGVAVYLFFLISTHITINYIKNLKNKTYEKLA